MVIDKTWQDAAREAVNDIYNLSYADGTTTPDHLVKFMRLRFDQIIKSIDNYNYVTEASLTIEGQRIWNFIGRHALNILTILGWRPEPSDMLNTLIKKQKDYGPENIARFGNIGLLIRMHDKIARLENILSKTDNDFNAAINIHSVADETIQDTLIDIIGYSAIALMWSTIDDNGNRAFLYKMGKDEEG